jgi:hypothetical protein
MAGKLFERSRWQPVKSSNVEAIRWIAGNNLEVKFLAKGNQPSSVYRYFGVPVSVFEKMLAAPSKGKFVWQELRGRYLYKRIK